MMSYVPRRLFSSSLSGRIALITGAGSGIGRATCKALAEDDCLIVAGDLDENKSRETIEQITKNLPAKDASLGHIACHVNVAKRDSVEKMFAQVVAQLKRPPTILVN